MSIVICVCFHDSSACLPWYKLHQAARSSSNMGTRSMPWTRQSRWGLFKFRGKKLQLCIFMFYFLKFIIVIYHYCYYAYIYTYMCIYASLEKFCLCAFGFGHIGGASTPQCFGILDILCFFFWGILWKQNTNLCNLEDLCNVVVNHHQNHHIPKWKADY